MPVSFTDFPLPLLPLLSFFFFFFFYLFRKPTASYHRHLSTFFQRRATRFPQKGVPYRRKEADSPYRAPTTPAHRWPVHVFLLRNLDITWYTRNFVLSHASNPVISWPVNICIESVSLLNKPFVGLSSVGWNVTLFLFQGVLASNRCV